MHAGVANYYGGANKNMGGAFLLAWKICDGKLPGLKDPRDSNRSKESVMIMDSVKEMGEPRKSDIDMGLGNWGQVDEYERHKSLRRKILIKCTGAGRVHKFITPEEMVDSALAGFLKVRVDVHNKNLDGSWAEFLHHPKVRRLGGEAKSE